MLATLDPLALPIATEVLSGEKADDPLYVPASELMVNFFGYFFSKF